MYELRCPKCGTLLLKYDGIGEIEIKCPKCGCTVRVRIGHSDGGLVNITITELG